MVKKLGTSVRVLTLGNLLCVYNIFLWFSPFPPSRQPPRRMCAGNIDYVKPSCWGNLNRLSVRGLIGTPNRKWDYSRPERTSYKVNYCKVRYDIFYLWQFNLDVREKFLLLFFIKLLQVQKFLIDWSFT